MRQYSFTTFSPERLDGQYILKELNKADIWNTLFSYIVIFIESLRPPE